MENFKTPPDHIAFLAKKLFGECGRIIDGSVAYIEPDGGGPAHPHTHEHSHLFIVVSGEIVIRTPEENLVVRSNESSLVRGTTEHSVWNRTAEKAVVIGISVMPDDNQG